MVTVERPIGSKIESTQINPEYREFEGIKIQWNKVPWKFNHSELGEVSIDTYSIWNPKNHEEIATRLAKGETAALYMMGTFGIGELRGKRGEKLHDPIFDDIKKRDRTQSLAAFAHPDDISDFIDFERLPESLKHLTVQEKRRALYKSPVHIIFPIVEEKLPDLGTIREEKSASFFWMNGHWGYESLAEKVKAKVSGVILGGGSLNVHGEQPSTTTSELKERIEQNPDWLRQIDFVILDEIAENAAIGRSHTQISFMEDPPRVIRKGSQSPEKFSKNTGYRVVLDETAKEASSKTLYDEANNLATDKKVESLLAQIARFKLEMEV
jgi:tRNA A37 threonylcarbamoyladenosine synthetase subunit TsaC/SUA5/YrdC